ncbi:hypothetical protein GGS23DRAFT_564940 [Durotheca rogersii]|uniref:uncharacterized protein n=1 Tax=Durotheca rogersii TaxID=419775 RepID=UPI0022200987|nr:uncharacterized protein GGS23DRAFT_564940 [Durotheca rogersii]KAI5863680.1 hypothetical protein GGS23DRAFT_564940 [Durotheca rogersii]
MCGITKEVGHLREIKDVKDELRVIRKVLEDKEAVINQYRAHQRGPHRPKRMYWPA